MLVKACFAFVVFGIPLHFLSFIQNKKFELYELPDATHLPAWQLEGFPVGPHLLANAGSASGAGFKLQNCVYYVRNFKPIVSKTYRLLSSG